MQLARWLDYALIARPHASIEWPVYLQQRHLPRRPLRKVATDVGCLSDDQPIQVDIILFYERQIRLTASWRSAVFPLPIGLQCNTVRSSGLFLGHAKDNPRNAKTMSVIAPIVLLRHDQNPFRSADAAVTSRPGSLF